MKQSALTVTGDATAQAAIAFITHWVKKYSFLFIKYANWHICTTNDKVYAARLDFDLSYVVESNAAAKEVIQYFREKGMVADNSNANETNRCIYLYKKGL
jgi:hypothetical protein